MEFTDEGTHMVTCMKMTPDTLEDAELILTAFLSEDEYYLDSSEAYGHAGDDALKEALTLFLQHPEAGFVWLAYNERQVAAACAVSFAISTSIGGFVAKLDDVYVRSGRRSIGVGSEMLAQLKWELMRQGIRRIDTSAHIRNERARRFYLRNGFVPLNEERLAYVLR